MSSSPQPAAFKSRPSDPALTAGSGDVPAEKNPLELADDAPQDDEDLAAPPGGPRPPPAPIYPATFVLAPQSVVVQLRPAAAGEARPAYQLSRPLNGHATATRLIDVPAGRRLRADGTLATVRPRDELYDLWPPRVPFAGVDPAEVVLSPRHRDAQPGGRARLRRGVRVGLAGVRTHFEASAAGGRVLCRATLRGGALAWRDGDGGALVAVERPARDGRADAERLEVVGPLDKRRLDLMVAIWIARIYQDTQRLGAREEKQDAKRRRAHQKQLDKEMGRPSGLVHDVKEALGIGYGLKPGSTRMGGMFTAPPALKEDGRINWGGK